MKLIKNNLSNHAKTTAGAAVVASLAVPLLAGLWAPLAPLLIPVAVAVPFITMTMLDAELTREHRDA